MYLTHRSALIRNLAVALLNGLVTLTLLLIAPIGLAGVISTTLAVTLASLINATLSDTIVRYLQPSRNPNLNPIEPDSTRRLEP
jgi:hypothetical protein